MTVVNMINFVLFWTESFRYLEAGAGNSSELTNSISVIMVSRMMLNIMEAADPRGDNFSGDTEILAENRPIRSSLLFTTQNSAVTTGPLVCSMHRLFDPAHEGTGSSGNA